MIIQLPQHKKKELFVGVKTQHIQGNVLSRFIAVTGAAALFLFLIPVIIVTARAVRPSNDARSFKQFAF